MLTHVVHDSEQLCSFFNQLDVHLGQLQCRHIVRMVDALLVYEDNKTLEASQRQFIEAPDVSYKADFLPIRPWQANTVRAVLRANQLAWRIVEAKRRRLPRVIKINLDDSLGEKHKDTRDIEPIDWHGDHTKSSKKQSRYKNGICYLVCTATVGD